MAVVLVAAAGGSDDGVGGIHGTLSRPPSDVVLIMSLPHGVQNMCALVGVVHTVEEPITMRATDTPTTVHNTVPPLLDGGWEQMDGVLVGTDAAKEPASASYVPPPGKVWRSPLTQVWLTMYPHKRTYTSTTMLVQMSIHVHTDVYMGVYIYIYVCMYIYTFIHTHTHTCKCTQTCTHIYVYVCVCVCVGLCT